MSFSAGHSPRDQADTTGLRVARRVAVLDSLDLLGPGIALLRHDGVDVVVAPADASATQAIGTAAGAPVAIVGVLPVHRTELESLAAGGTTLLVRPGIGFDHIDVAAASDVGITVANVPDYCVDEVADHTLLLLLAAQRRLREISALATAGWSVTARLPPVERVAGATLGIVGLGRIGGAVALRAKAFGWRLVAHDPFAPDERFARLGVHRAGLEELFRVSTAIALHCPLGPDTRHLVNAARLRLVRPGTVLVNTSRGDLVDLDAVDAAVADGSISAVGFDVLPGEPNPPLDHPLLSRPQVLLTPHIAWYSLAAREDLGVKSAREALRWLDTGAVLHPVNTPPVDVA